jgi:DNA-binding protein Fis
VPVSQVDRVEDLSMDAVEKDHLERVLSKAGWNIGKAADILKIHRNTLTAKLKKYNIEKKNGGQASTF